MAQRQHKTFIETAPAPEAFISSPVTTSDLNRSAEKRGLVGQRLRLASRPLGTKRRGPDVRGYQESIQLSGAYAARRTS
jgi:hypothetical protein